MGYSQWGHKELDMTQRLTFSYSFTEKDKTIKAGRLLSCSLQFSSVWARESTAPAQGIQSLSRELRASALCPGLDRKSVV